MNPWRRLNGFGRALLLVTVLVVLAEIVTQSNAVFLVLGGLAVIWTLIAVGFGSDRGPRGGPGGWP